MDELIIEARGASHRYPGADRPAVERLDLELRAGELLGVVGPNGSGKTTLIRLLLGVLPVQEGTIRVLGRPVGEWDRRSLARAVGVVAQREEPAFPLRVRHAVLLGRYPHMGALAAPRAADVAAVEDALTRCNATDLAGRWVTTLSGGEWQRVRVARALAQSPRALLLDEATANLDLRHEMEVFQLVAGLVREAGLAALMVTHHVNLAARFVHRLIVLDKGRAVASGPPAEIMTHDVMSRVYAWPVATQDFEGIPQVIPLKTRDV